MSHPEHGGYTPEEYRAAPERPDDDGKGVLRRLPKPLRHLGIAAGVAAAGLAGAKALERQPTPDVPRAPEIAATGHEDEVSPEGESNLDDVKNGTSEKISRDFGPIHFTDWEKIIDAYDAGFYIYGGKAGEHLVALKNAEGRDMLVPLSDLDDEEERPSSVASPARIEMEQRAARQRVTNKLEQWLETRIPAGSEDSTAVMLASMPDGVVERIERDPAAFEEIAQQLLESAEGYAAYAARHSTDI